MTIAFLERSKLHDSRTGVRLPREAEHYAQRTTAQRMRLSLWLHLHSVAYLIVGYAI